MNTWPSILEAVRDPFALAALTILVVMIVLKLSLSKVTTLTGTSAFRTVRYSITIAGVLAFIVAIGAMSLRLYELHAKAKGESVRLTRIEAEAILQKNRGNIERCLSRLPQKHFFVDFVFTLGDDHAVNMDVIPGQAALPETEFLHPELRKREVEGYSGHDALWLLSRSAADKLSVTAPDVNGCIIDSLRNDLRRYSLDDGSLGFVHRYITDEGER